MGNCCKKSKVADLTRTILPTVAHPQPTEDDPIPVNPNAMYANNRVRTTKYKWWNFIFLNLWEQLHRVANVYFIFIVLLNFVPEVGAFAKEVAPLPVIFVLLVTAIKDAIEDIRRLRADRNVNHSVCEVYSQEHDDFVKEEWQDIHAGDFLRLQSNSIIPADILLLHSSNRAGICNIETANLDGETNLKLREVISGFVTDTFCPNEFVYPIEVESPNDEIYKFNGTLHKNSEKVALRKENLILRGCVIRNTDFVLGMVIYAGNETKAMLNNKGPRFKRSKLERQINKDVIWCVVILIVLCLTGAIGGGIWLQSFPNSDIIYLVFATNTESPAFQAFLNFWTFVIIFQAMIPLPLYVTLELVKLGQLNHISNDLELYDEVRNKPVEVKAFNITEDLGQIQYVFADKTGTLTENKMEFKRCSISGRDFEDRGEFPPMQIKEPEKIREPTKEPLKKRRSKKTMFKASKKQKRLSETSINSNTPILENEQEVGGVHSNGNNLENGQHKDSISVPTLHTTIPEVNQATCLSTIHTDVEAISFRRPDPVDADKTRQRIQDFVMVMAICNTAVVSISKNEDTPMEIPIPKKHKRGHKIFKKPHLLRGGRSASPSPSVETRDSHPGILPTADNGNLHSNNNPVNKRSGGSKLIGGDSLTSARGAHMVDTLKLPPLPGNKGFLPPIRVDMTAPEMDSINTLLTEGGSYSPEPSRGMLGIPMVPSEGSISGDTGSLFDDGASSVAGTLDGASASHAHLNGPAPCPYPDDFLISCYEVESPDELSLVKAACECGVKLVQRGPGFVTIWMPSEGLVNIQILHSLAFDSDRKRMSVIFRHPYTKEVILFSKGADSVMMALMERSEGAEDHTVEVKTNEHLKQYSVYGLRTLVMGKRMIPEDVYQNWRTRFSECEGNLEDNKVELDKLMTEIESGLQLLGATGIEDRLQDGVPDTIASLREAGIKVWVLTGDKQETAINIAYSAKLITIDQKLMILNADDMEEAKEKITKHLSDISQDYPAEVEIRQRRERPPVREDLALCVDGKTLEFSLKDDIKFEFLMLAEQCSSVICCRTTPIQKADVVSLVGTNLRMQTLAIGDGANDVSMIQRADVGIGISGQEGMQAVMASDFALSQFRFLKKLLLVHGHLNYDRLSRTALYMFYKDTLLIFVMFWFQLFCGFSGTSMIDQVFALCFNLTMTSIPPIIFGIWDMELGIKTLMKNPCLYRDGIQCKSYLPHHFWVNIGDAVWQSIVIFFIPYLMFTDTEMGIWTFGYINTTSLVAVACVHIGIETFSWTILHWFSLIGSLLIPWFFFAMIYNTVCKDCISPEAPYWIIFNLMNMPSYWLCWFVSVSLAVFPRLVIRTINNSAFPSMFTRARQLEAVHGVGEKLPLMPKPTIFPITRSHSLIPRPSRRVRPMSAPSTDMPGANKAAQRARFVHRTETIAADDVITHAAHAHTAPSQDDHQTPPLANGEALRSVPQPPNARHRRSRSTGPFLRMTNGQVFDSEGDSPETDLEMLQRVENNKGIRFEGLSSELSKEDFIKKPTTYPATIDSDSKVHSSNEDVS